VLPGVFAYARFWTSIRLLNTTGNFIDAGAAKMLPSMSIETLPTATWSQGNFQGPSNLLYFCCIETGIQQRCQHPRLALVLNAIVDVNVVQTDPCPQSRCTRGV
jgi:hypothetical protein